MAIVSFGSGVLAWPPDDRTSVHLDASQGGQPPHRDDIDTAPRHRHGQLVAVILTSRPVRRPRNIVDAPAEANVGDHITLGTGRLFVERISGSTLEIGVIPESPTGGHDWLDTDALYRCYQQILRLEFRTDTDAAISASTERS